MTSRELMEYAGNIQPDQNILFLIDALIGNINTLAQHLPQPTTEEEQNLSLFHNFLINEVGRNMPVAQYQRWWIEVWLTRSVDAFQYYLSQILFRVYKERPETLKGSENKVEIGEVLEAGSIEAFINNCAEQRVSVLAYRGLPKLIEYLNRNLHIKFDTSNPDFQAACEIVEVRNIIVHNRGRVSKIFLQRLPHKADEGLTAGDLYPLDFRYAIDANGHLRRLAEALDARIVEHFHLETWPPSEETQDEVAPQSTSEQ